MSASLETIFRLRAWKEGKPLRRGEKINVSVADDDDLMIIAFLRMGGESRPWGVAFGNCGTKPEVLTVPDGRNRTLVADMMADFGSTLLGFFRHPAFSTESPANYETDTPRQIWLPGPTHVEMFHLLALAYARTRFQRDDVELLRRFGNLANCLYIEHQRPGQQTVVSAAAALRDTYYFPSAAIRQAHLGHLLGWLNGGNSRTRRLAAATEAEENSVATTLNPGHEERALEPEVERWNKARQSSDEAAMSASARTINRLLTEELIRRWHLTCDSIQQLRSDRRDRNPGLADLVKSGKKQFYELWGERALREYDGQQPYWPNVYTDRSPRTSARRFISRIAESEEARFHLVHGDRELQREELADGHGVIATVVKVDRTEPHWRLKYSYPELPTLSAGDHLVLASLKTLKLIVDEVDFTTRSFTATPDWKNAKRDLGPLALASRDKSWEKRQLILLDDPAYGLTRSLASRAGAKLDGVPDLVDLIEPTSRFQAANDDEGPVSEPSEQE
jgi:hypothetical protein